MFCTVLHSVHPRSFGVLLFELVSRQSIGYVRVDGVVANVNGFKEYAAKIALGARPRIPQQVPVAVADIIQQCWAQDHRQRPSLE